MNQYYIKGEGWGAIGARVSPAHSRSYFDGLSTSGPTPGFTPRRTFSLHARGASATSTGMTEGVHPPRRVFDPSPLTPRRIYDPSRERGLDSAPLDPSSASG